MNYWLLNPNQMFGLLSNRKSWKKGVAWDGVRNYQANNNLKKMEIGDKCFFYHSNIGKEIVGVVIVSKSAFIDKTDVKRFLLFRLGLSKNLLLRFPWKKLKKTRIFLIYLS